MKWPTGSLDSIAILDRQSVHPSEVDAATPYLGLEHLDGDGGIDCIQTVGSAGPKSNKFRFSDRHVLFGKLRPYLRKIVRPEFSGVCSTDIIPILPKEGMSRDYLFYFLRAPDTVNLATRRSSGANLPRLAPKQLASFQVPLPPLDEQKRIAEILDKADALRAKRRAALAQLDTLTQAIFLDMFGDPATNPKGWPISRVGAVAKQIRGVTYSKGEGAKEPKAGFLPILRAGNIAAGDIVMDDLVFVPAERVAEEQLLRSSDVLIATSSGSLHVVGKAARVQDDMPVGFGAFCKVLRPGSEVDPTFFAAFFSTQHYRRRVSQLAAGININNLRKEHLDNFQLPRPPRDLQRAFAAIIAATIACRASSRGSLSLLNALFASLQHRAFRGEL